MFDVRRYLSMDPWTGLITLISDRTYLNLEPTTCSLQALESLGGLATRVTITTNRSTSSANLLPPLPKVLEYTFERLDPDSFFRTGIQAIEVDGLKLPISTDAILTRLGQITGVVFDLDDFDQQVFTEYGPVTLQSRYNSLRWVGQLSMTLVNSLQQQLSDVMVVKSASLVFRTLGGIGRTLDIVYSADHDFTQYRTDLKALLNSPNGLDNARLTNVLRWVTGDAWVCTDEPAPYNIGVGTEEGQPVYEIIYSGSPVTRFTPRTDKRSLIVLRLDQTRCTGLSGMLLLHYD